LQAEFRIDIMTRSAQRQDMRTTLTLDDDVAAELTAEARRAGRPFEQIVNETLRDGLASRRVAAERPAFKIAARDLGELRPGLSLDKLAELIERAEGPLHR
jgi:plasmid stability protein